MGEPQVPGAAHVSASPSLNRRPVWVGSLFVIAPVIVWLPPGHGVAVAVPTGTVTVRVAVGTRVLVRVTLGGTTEGVVLPTGVTLTTGVGVPPAACTRLIYCAFTPLISVATRVLLR